MQCFHECAASYTIAWQEAEGATAAIATPGTATCTAMPTIVCSPVLLNCAKPFSEFPNACSGIVPLVKDAVSFFVAFYAFSEDVGSGKSQQVMATRVVADADTICSGNYKVDEGNCLGLSTSVEAQGPAIAPPMPPDIPNMPAKFPEIKPQADTTTTPSTKSTTSATTPEPTTTSTKGGD